MADLTKTITNSLNIFGGSPSSKWAAWNWNAFKWGDGTADLAVDVTHLISESVAPDSAILQNDVVHLISESLASTSEMISETLTDGSGWYYVFPSDVTNHENQSLASYTVGSTPSNTWTAASASTTTWS